MKTIREKLEKLIFAKEQEYYSSILHNIRFSKSTGVDDEELDRLSENLKRYSEQAKSLTDEIERDFRDLEGKSYAEIQPALAECLARFAEIYGVHPEFGNTIWSYSMAACDEIEQLRKKVKPKKRQQCKAFIRHGPGHQSKTRCRLTEPHDIHEARYGSMDRLARWAGDEISSGYFDEAPIIEEEET